MSKLVWKRSNMSLLVQTCRYLSRHVSNCPNMFKLVQQQSYDWKSFQSCFFFNFNIIQDLLKFLLNFMLLHIFVVTLYAFAYFLSLAESFRGMYFWKNAKFLQCFVFVIWDSLKSRAVLFFELSLMLKQPITNQTRF